MNRRIKFSNKPTRDDIACYNLGNNIANHMACILLITLYDHMGFTPRQLNNVGKFIVETRTAWQDDDNEEVTNYTLLKFAENKGVHVYKFAKTLPTSWKMYLADAKPGNTSVYAMQSIEGSVVAVLLICVKVMIEHYRFSVARCNEMFNWFYHYIKGYNTKTKDGRAYDDEWIRQVFIEDTGWDIRLGKKVS